MFRVIEQSTKRIQGTAGVGICVGIVPGHGVLSDAKSGHNVRLTLFANP